MKSVLGEHQFPIGSSVDVQVSCVESPAKFWCQMTQNNDTLVLLMQDIHTYYASNTQQPVEPICIARHPDNGMWYRARLTENSHSPPVEVRFIDYGDTRRVALGDLRPIDPGFLELNAQAFQCCLHNVNRPASTWSDSASVEFHKFLDLANSSKLGLKCTVKAVVCDPQGPALNVVDIETPFQSACKLLAQKGITQTEAPMKVHPPPPGISDAYNYSTNNIEVGGEEKVLITCSESVDLFFCQLDRNSHLFDELVENIQQLCRRPQSTDHPLVLNNICFAKYTDNRWYRGQITATHPDLQVHFVDYGETVEVNKCDILPFPVEASTARSVYVQAIPLGLYKIPADVSQEINDWFGHYAIGYNYTISVVAKDSSGKLIVELYDGPLNVNVMIREKIAKARQRQEAGLVQQTDQQPSCSSNKRILSISREECQTQGSMSASPLRKMMEQSKANSSNGKCMEAKQNADRQVTPHIAMPELVLEPAMDGLEEQTQRSVRINDLPQKLMQQGLVTEVYVSHFNSPSSFFVQLKKDENDVNGLVEKLNESQSFYDTPVEFSDLQIGDLVKAEYPDDCSWYRAVVRSKFEDKTVSVEFIDFGNEATISYLKICCLDEQLTECPRFSIPCILAGVANKLERWNKEAISMFQNATRENPEKTFACTFIREGENAWEVCLEDHGILMADTFVQGGQTEDEDSVLAEMFVKGGQTEYNHVTQLNYPEEIVTICRYRKPNISQHQTEEVYVSSIVGPHYFWCQHAKSEDLNQMSSLAQEVGHAEVQDMMCTETLGPGSPCMALFSDDETWYRAQVIRKADNVLTVLFIDYGNESEVDIKNVKSVPPTLLEKAPQAFLCSLAGFDEPKGTWDDDALDEFYDLLVDKLLNVTILKMEDNVESRIPLYNVKIECGEMVVNNLMEKYWKVSTAEDATAELRGSQ